MIFSCFLSYFLSQPARSWCLACIIFTCGSLLLYCCSRVAISSCDPRNTREYFLSEPNTLLSPVTKVYTAFKSIQKTLCQILNFLPIWNFLDPIKIMQEEHKSRTRLWEVFSLQICWLQWKCKWRSEESGLHQDFEANADQFPHDLCPLQPGSVVCGEGSVSSVIYLWEAEWGWTGIAPAVIWLVFIFGKARYGILFLIYICYDV